MTISKKELIPMTDLEQKLMSILDTTAYHYAMLIKKYFETKEEEKGDDEHA